MDENRLLADLVEGRVEKRMRRARRFGIHLVTGIGLMFLAIFAAKQGLVGDGVMVGLLLGTMFSMALHITWLTLSTTQAAITQEEIEHIQQLYPELAALSLEREKPKRHDSTLAEDDEEAPLDLDLLAGEDERRSHA